MHFITVATIDRMARRPPIDILVECNVFKLLTPMVIIANAAVVVSHRGPVRGPRDYHYRDCGRVHADALKLGRGVMVSWLIIFVAIGVDGGAVSGSHG